jgi:hypothetical protein
VPLAPSPFAAELRLQRPALGRPSVHSRLTRQFTNVCHVTGAASALRCSQSSLRCSSLDLTIVYGLMHARPKGRVSSHARVERTTSAQEDVEPRHSSQLGLCRKELVDPIEGHCNVTVDESSGGRPRRPCSRLGGGSAALPAIRPLNG